MKHIFCVGNDTLSRIKGVRQHGTHPAKNARLPGKCTAYRLSVYKTQITNNVELQEIVSHYSVIIQG